MRATLQNFKDIFDLYITDSTVEPTQLSSKTGDDANSEFAFGDAVFYQNGTWAWTDLSNAASNPTTSVCCRSMLAETARKTRD